MLLAVLHRHAGIACFDQDVFVNAWRVKISEPAADLAVLAAIVSSLRSQPLPTTGDVREVASPAKSAQCSLPGALKEAASSASPRPSCRRLTSPAEIAGMMVHAVQRLDEQFVVQGNLNSRSCRVLDLNVYVHNIHS